ncbi:hypothetical protein B0H19DRAFT_957631, partial [Mycena capillaripes]
SAFGRALDKYIKTLSDKKYKQSFIVACSPSGARITPESIHASIQIIEQQHSEQPGMRILHRILGPVVKVLQGYDSILGTLVSVDPMPSAIVWGGLKIIIEGVHRFLNLFETIKQELEMLTAQLNRINEFHNLYGNSDRLQELFCSSFINMLRFWSRVNKECNTPFTTGLLKAATSFSTNKLNLIIKDIKDDADQIEKHVSILEASMGKKERQAAELERLQAGSHRTAAEKEWDTQAAWRDKDEGDRQGLLILYLFYRASLNISVGERYREISTWLSARLENLNEGNMRIFLAHQERHLNGTCDWLLQNPMYIDWRDGRSLASILWVHAPPAAGKSVLSTRVIQVIMDAAKTVVYHFYRFDQTTSASETLRLLASQLFDEYWNQTKRIPQEIYLKTKKSLCSLENAKELITTLVKLLPETYFIVDGLDEECKGLNSIRWKEAATVLDFLLNIAKGSPSCVWLWCSSQYHPDIHTKLKDHIVLDIQHEVKQDVTLYLSRDNPELSELEISDLDKDNILRSLQARAEGNFLWARLMIESLKETSSLTEMKNLVASGLPETLDDYYRRIFDRFEQPLQRSLVGKVFALVAFARRPLRMRELCEAVGLLQSKNPRSLNRADMPFGSRLRKLLPPFIETRQDTADPDDCTCTLSHSTVLHFILHNPDVLQNGLQNPAVDLAITPDVIANACLLYLSQTRYSRLLRKRDTGKWVDASGESIDRHHFLLYSAKYWDKGLDLITRPSKDLDDRVSSFIASSNFETLVQVQSLWVDAQFQVFRLVGGNEKRTFLRRMFPLWLTRGDITGSDGMKLWRDFRGFLHEWKYLLACYRCEDPDCLTSPYTGELDRCWWPALGPQSFLSKLKCRYTTFTFRKADVIGNSTQCFEGVRAEDVVTLRLTFRDSESGELRFTCEQWSCTTGRVPILKRIQTIVTDENTTGWLLYVKHSGKGTSNMRVGQTLPATFTQSNQFLRIGSQLFSRIDLGDYTAIPGINGLHINHAPCLEEFAKRGHVTVLATRQGLFSAQTYDTGLPDEKIDTFGVDFTKMEATPGFRSWDDTGTDSDSDSSVESDTSTDPENALGYETWSECSSEHSDGFDDDIITPWAGPGSDIGDDTSTDSDSSDESKTDVGGAESDAEDSDIEPLSVIGYGMWHDDERDNAWMDSDSDDEHGPLQVPSVATLQNWHPRPQTGLEASITIFNSSDGVPLKIFHFRRALPFLLYDSPPVIHPSKSLVVWPLSAGDVLFADFLAKTYFVRKLRPSTARTRHISMKCQFSPCGRYMHVASLEGQQTPVSVRKKASQDSPKPPLKLALLVSTYRLSARKTCRSPPSLIYRVRLDLGSVTTISVSKLPCTLTWTATELYFTRSGKTLSVFRIPLFGSDRNESPEMERHVLVPRKPIFLPHTAENRDVYYFPPDGDSTICRVIIGSETRGRKVNETEVADQFFAAHGDSSGKYVFGLQSRLAPPVGCYLDEQTDLGGWRKSDKRSELPGDLGIGQLDQRLEKFDPEDDCDCACLIFTNSEVLTSSLVEPYIF